MTANSSNNNKPRVFFENLRRERPGQVISISEAHQQYNRGMSQTSDFKSKCAEARADRQIDMGKIENGKFKVVLAGQPAATHIRPLKVNVASVVIQEGSGVTDTTDHVDQPISSPDAS